LPKLQQNSIAYGATLLGKAQALAPDQSSSLVTSLFLSTVFETG